MEIKSPAGDFKFEVDSLEREGDDLVLVGKMGVWETRTHISPADFLQLLGKIVLRLRFWVFLMRLPVIGLRRLVSTSSTPRSPE